MCEKFENFHPKQSGMCRQSGSFRRGILEELGFSITLDFLIFLTGDSWETGFPIRIIPKKIIKIDWYCGLLFGI
jgi:hypothetical protein